MTGALGRLLEERLAPSSGYVFDAAGGRVPAARLLDMAADVARSLKAQDLRPDEPVFVVIGARAADLANMLGVWMAGGVAAPVHASASTTTWRAVRVALGARVVLDGAAASFEDRPAPAQRAELAGAAVIVFTSGTTGAPKGVIIRHQGFVGKLEALDRVIRLTRDDLTAVPLQLTFIFGQWVTFLALRAGGSVVLMSKLAPAVCASTPISGVTALGAVPSTLRALAQGPRPFERLRTIISGGEPLGGPLSEATLALWPDASIFDMYGLTETGAADFCSISTADFPAGAWIGRPTAGVSYRIVQDDGSPAPAGAPGELQIRTEHGMAGYLGDPELTARSFSDGHFRTGDLAVEGADRRLALIGRIKEVISRAGNKIYPAEIETALHAHPDVAAALCAGTPDAQFGERIYAVAVLKPEASVGVPELRAWLGERLERYKVPDFLSIVDALPLGSTGKASRAALRDIALRERAEALETAP
ncbi:class I adenylate-forming enzyme family protein [Hansschlegelia sp. KR7-227]|uniref:class I adenylate-forming enzyme family protein n=1 Tax=Hansschlegelia sp. KR7-227 TaxID=3400914 RepID=UPI003C0B50D4